MSQYRYYPEDKRKLELNEVIFKMRDFRLVWICVMFPMACLLFPINLACFSFVFLEASTIGSWIVSIVVMLCSLLLSGGVYIAIRSYMKHKDERQKILEHAKRFQLNTDESFIDQIQEDLYKGIPFVKSHNILVSENYIFGSLKETGLDLVVIPKEQIIEVVHKYESEWTFVVNGFHRLVKQQLVFKLKNGKNINVFVSDKFHPELAWQALKNSGIKVVDISPEN